MSDYTRNLSIPEGKTNSTIFVNASTITFLGLKVCFAKCIVIITGIVELLVCFPLTCRKGEVK